MVKGLECTEDINCEESNKNKCNTETNRCECNDGFDVDEENCVCMAGEVDNEGACNPCKNNEFVSSQAKCEECPPGQEPMVDRKSCMNCPDDKISTNGICMECTDPSQVPNNAMTACVGMLDVML